MLRQLKLSALTRQDAETANLADKITDLWQQMMLSEGELRAKTTGNYRRVCSITGDVLQELSRVVAHLESSVQDLDPFVDQIARHLADLEKLEEADCRLADMGKELQEKAALVQDFEQQVKALSEELKPCAQERDAARQRMQVVSAANDKLTVRLDEVRKEERLVRSRVKSLETDSAQLRRTIAELRDELSRSGRPEACVLLSVREKAREEGGEGGRGIREGRERGIMKIRVEFRASTVEERGRRHR